MIKIGLRVVRGPNWTLENEDGGEGYTGTLYDVNIKEKTAIVQWDNGNQTVCKIGQMNKYELRILDNAQVVLKTKTTENRKIKMLGLIKKPKRFMTLKKGVAHKNIYCNLCRYIKGTRFKCNICIDYDLCESCYNKKKHSRDHSFKKIVTPIPRFNPLSYTGRNNKSDIQHIGVQCDECRSEVFGIRYNCNICCNFDLCNFCYRSKKHNPNHIFKRIDIPNTKGVNLPPQSNFNYVTFHRGVTCDGCGMHNIHGTRYKCNSCRNYDLCELCYHDNKHNLDHSFRKIDLPNATGFDLPPRLSTAVNEIVHTEIHCDACGIVQIHGVRYKCDNCSDYDLCHSCYYGNEHDLRHSFIKIESPDSLGILLSPRSTFSNNIKQNKLGIVHNYINCDECPLLDICGIRYHCSDCGTDINLCHICYHGGMHDLTHSFIRIDVPHSLGIQLPPRIISRQCDLKGIFKGAKVIPGIDWGCQNQNISQDKPGVVLDIREWTEEETWRSAAYVMWQQGNKQLCRLGYKGHCDIQFVEAAPGSCPHYYPDHLPTLGQTEEQMQFHYFMNALENPGDEQDAGAFADCSLQELRDFEQLSLSELGSDCGVLNTASESTSGENLNNITSSDERVKELENKIIEMEESMTCAICLEEKRNVVFLCGHGSCSNCADNLQSCHMCRKPIEKKIRMY